MSCHRKMLASGALPAPILAAGLLLGAIGAKAQPLDNQPLWLSQYSEAGKHLDLAQAVAVSPDGARVFVTGMSQIGINPDPEYATVAYDAATGERLWVRRYNGVEICTDTGAAMAVSPDGTGCW